MSDVKDFEIFDKPKRALDGDSFDFDELDERQSRNYMQSNIIHMTRNITPSGASAQEIKITDGTEIALVDSNGALTVNIGKRTATALSGINTNNATTTIGTVPAGKVWRVIYAEISGTIGNAVLTNKIQLNNVDTVVMTVTGLAGVLNTSKGVIQTDYENALVLTEGQTIKTVVGASGYGSYNILYIEESA